MPVAGIKFRMTHELKLTSAAIAKYAAAMKLRYLR